MWLVGVGLAVGLCLSVGAAPARADERIRVATKEIEPFVILEEERLTGFSVDLWEEVAALHGFEYEWVVVDSVAEQLDAVAEGRADVALAAISITSEREETIDFSHPYFRSGLRILAKSRDVGVLKRLVEVLLSPRLLALYAFIAVILVVIGTVAWLLERNRNDHFPSSFGPGVWEGIWWAAATVTTVGYGDRTVRGKSGRVLGLVWMFFGIFLVANFTAVVAAELTRAREDTVVADEGDLHNARVATVTGTTSADYLDAEGIGYVGVDTIGVAVELLSDGSVDAVVFDGPVLQYQRAHSADPTLVLVGDAFNREDYGIAMPLDSPHRQRINIALLELWENGTHAELLRKWSITDL